MLSKKLGATINKDNPLNPHNNKYQQEPSNITSPFFSPPEITFWARFYTIECRLNVELSKLSFPYTTYNPTEYASEIHCAFLQKYLAGNKNVLFIGMNPGPWGMCQTGIPFGSAAVVRDWMHISGEVTKPAGEINVRPVDGLSCTRDEQSGKRFWTLIQYICGSPEIFFDKCFVHNLCPLAFLDANKSGKNVTPNELKAIYRNPLERVCLEYLKLIIELIAPKKVIAIGKYVEKCLTSKDFMPKGIEIIYLTHPSPRSVNNTDWVEKSKTWWMDNQILD